MNRGKIYQRANFIKKNEMSTLAFIGIIVVTAIAMEFVAWFSHKYIMHGFLWSWHEDHHQPHQEGDGFFEKNDQSDSPRWVYEH